MEIRSEENVFTRISQVLIVLILLVVPFPFGSTQDLWILVLESAISFLLVLWAVSQLLKGEITFVKTRLTWPVLGLTAYLAITLLPVSQRILNLLSSDTAFLWRSASEMAGALESRTLQRFPITLTPFDTEGELLKFLCYALFFFLALNLLRYGKVYLVMFRIIVATGAVVAAIGLVQSVWTNGKIYWTFASGSGSPFGPFANHNHFAGYIELALGLSLGLFLVEVGRFKEKSGIHGASGYIAWIFHKDGSGAWILFVASFLMIASLMASMSRGGILSFGAAGLIFALRALWYGKRAEADASATRPRRKLRILIASGLATVLIVMAILASAPRARARWVNLFDSSFHYRLDIWRSSLGALADFTLTGTGLGSFRAIFPHYLTWPFTSEVTHAENEYLQWVFETGFIGLVLLVIAALALAHLVVFRLGSRKDFRARCLGYGALFSLTSIAIHNFCDFNMHIPSNAITTTAVIVLCLVAINFHKGKHGDRFLLESFRIPTRSIAGAAVIVCSLALAGLVTMRSWARYESLRSVEQWTKDHPYLPQNVPQPELLEPLERAARQASANDRAYFLQAAVYESAASAKGFLQLFKRGEMLAKAEQALAQAIQSRPTEARYWAALGRIELARQHTELAEKAFQHAVYLRQSDGVIHRDYATALLVAGKPQAAAAQFTIARNYSPSLPLVEMLDALASHTSDTRIWQSIIRYQADDLKTFAAFLSGQGLTSLSDQFSAEAADLEKDRPKPR